MKVKKPLDPRWLILIALFCSFVIAGIVTAVNYGRLGKPKKRTKTIIFTIIGFILIIPISLIWISSLPEIVSTIICGIINIAIGGYFAKDQERDYIEWKTKNGI